MAKPNPIQFDVLRAPVAFVVARAAGPSPENFVVWLDAGAAVASEPVVREYRRFWVPVADARDSHHAGHAACGFACWGGFHAATQTSAMLAICSADRLGQYVRET